MERAKALVDKKYGVMVHYLEGIQNGTGLAANPLGRRTEWNECVAEFDVEAFAESVSRTGAGYVIFSLCQVSRFICAPSETFDRLTGYGAGEACSERDLPYELAVELGKRGIDLYLYFTGDGPRGDERSAKAFGTLNQTGSRVTGAFVRAWAGVMRELAIRYGELVKGWWIDGCFDYIGYTDELLGIYKEAALAGNPRAVVTFNNGVVRPDMSDPTVLTLADGETEIDKVIDVINAKALAGDSEAQAVMKRSDTPKKYRYSLYEDFTAGESSYFDEIPVAGSVEGSVWHAMSFLGIPQSEPLYSVKCGWACPGCRYTAEFLKDYVNRVSAVGGAVTFDVFTDRYGFIDEGQVAALSAIRK